MFSKFLIPLLYVAVIIIANLSTTYFGIWVTPINAFFLIGAELVLRDILHETLSKPKMMMIVLVAGFCSYALNSQSKHIAIASFCAVTISCLVDFAVYARTKGSWIKRSNTSNFFSGFTDSLIFPLIAFGVFSPSIFILQWCAKFLGGFVWTLILHRHVTKFIQWNNKVA